jgi:S1-C subfamily serine protease
VNGFYKFLENIIPATVHIHTRIAREHPSATTLGTERMGSGTIIDDTGMILTVGYVVLGAQSIVVTLQQGDEVAARLVEIDFDSGLAILQADVPPLPGLTLGDSSVLSRGQQGLIIASTGPKERRVSEGLVTALEAFDAYWEYMLERAILTTATNLGLGGGAFVTLDGVMRGVVSLNLGDLRDTTMIIPLEYFHQIKDEILLHGRVVSRVPRAWLGLYPMPSPRGLVVFEMTAHGPAAQAGVQPGDIIVGINGQEMLNRREFYRQLWQHQAGAAIVLDILRDGTTQTITVYSQNRAEFFG